MHKFIQNLYPPPKPPTWRNHQTHVKKPTQKIHQTSNPEKSSNPYEKTEARNLKQINTHREKKNPGQRESDLIGSFPHSLSNQTHKKNHHLLQFHNPLPDPICDPHASTWHRSSDAVMLGPCDGGDGGDACADLLRVLRHAWWHEESPQGIHELD